MKVFQNKNLFKKLILILVLITVVSFCIPKGVSAKSGNVLLKPITDLFLTLGDGAVQLMHSIILHQNETLLNVDISSNEGLWTILAVVVTAVLVAAALIVAAPAIATALAAAGVTIGTMSIGTILLISVGTGSVAGVFIHSKFLDNDIKLPIYNISPEEIFSNSIPVFDVDFFNPQEGIVEKTKKVTKEAEYRQPYKYETMIKVLRQSYGMPNIKDCRKALYYGNNNLGNPYDEDKLKELEDLYDIKRQHNEDLKFDGEMEYQINFAWDVNDNKGKKWTYVLRNYLVAGGQQAYWTCEKQTVLDDGSVSKDEDFANKFSAVAETAIDENASPILSSPEETEEVVREIDSTSQKLQATISNWYVILRNIALVALLSILVYVGIRILISITSSDKAKYKQLLVDWVVAVCLLFIMQYIMSFSNLLVEKVTDLLGSVQKPQYLTLLPDVKDKVSEAITSGDNESILKQYGIIPKGNSASDLFISLSDDGKEDGSGEKYIQWNTNLMGVLRLKAQESKNETLEYTGYMIMFVMLVLFTVYFVYTYLKRVLYMSFLTVMAPLVAMTYPIDKMNDGKAQAFNMWFKEYIFNLLIQPLHLLLYTILVSSAIDFASTNIIYSLVAIAFMIPAEKLMRKFFGFEKAQTPGMLGGAAGAALAWGGVNRLMGHKPPKHPEKGNSKNNVSSDEGSNIRTSKYSEEFDKESALLKPQAQYKESADIENKKEEIKNVKPEVGENSNLVNNPVDNPINTTENTVYKPNSKSNTSDLKATNKKLDYSKIENDRKRKIKQTIRAGAGGTKYYLGGIGKKIVGGIAGSHPLRTATGLASAATFAMAGGIIGLTSGDPSKAAQYTALGASGGYNFGKSVYQGAASALDVSGTYEAAERAKYDTEEEYRRAKVEEQIKEIKKNKEFKAYAEQVLGEEQAKEMISSKFIDHLEMKGITDEKELMAAYELKNEKNLSDDETAALVKYSKLSGDISKMHSSDAEKWSDTFEGKLKKKGASDKIAKQKTKDIMEANKIYFKYRNDL